jgi:hypothetical protein
MVGFCYSFAFIELFDISKALDEAGKLTRSQGMTDFDEYPPHLFRLQQQVAILKKDKWWDELKSVDTHYVHLLERVDSMKETDFILSNFDPVHRSKVTAVFLTVVPLIFSELDIGSAGLGSGLDEWKCYARKSRAIWNMESYRRISWRRAAS